MRPVRGITTHPLSRFGLGLLASAVAAATNAQVEEPSNDIEQVEVIGKLSEYSATKFNAPIIETARSISIETASQFIDKGAINLSQTTTYMAGVTGETYGFATRGDWIRIRGLEVPRYRDSIQEVFGSYNNSRADIYTLEQVEVLKGPASVLYGQGSPGGIVNYVSKTPKPEAAHQIALEWGNYQRRQLAVDSTGAIGDSSFNYRLVALYRDSDTQVDYVDERVRIVMPSISYAPSGATEVTLIGMKQSSDSDTGSQFVPYVGTAVPLADGSYLDQDVYIGEPGWNQYNTESTQFTLLARHQLNDVFELKATALWRDGEADYNQAWAAFTGDGNSRFLNDIVGVAVATPTTVPRSFYQADNSSEQLAADIRLSAEFDTGAIGHEILFGVQYQDVTTDNNTAYFYGGGALSGDFSYALDLANPVYTGAPPQAVFDALYNDRPEQNVEDIGWYISNQMSIDNWRITLGLRRDEVDNDDGSRVQNDSATSLSGGVLYQFDNGLSPYLSYAESFETVIGTDVANRQLKPEEGRQYEAGLKFEPESFPGLITLAYFDIEISNLPNPNSLPNDAGQQQGVSELKGFEAEAKLQLGDFDIQASASVLDAQDPNGYELAATPDKHASLWLGWRPSEQWQGFKAGIGIRHVGRSINQTASLRYVSDSYTLGDLMLGYELDEHWDLALNVRNISDEEYLTSCLTRGDCFPGVRRSAVASVRYNF